MWLPRLKRSFRGVTGGYKRGRAWVKGLLPRSLKSSGGQVSRGQKAKSCIRHSGVGDREITQRNIKKL